MYNEHVLKSQQADDDSYGSDAGMWRENPHDDLVLAVALAVWYGEHYRAPSRRQTSFSFNTLARVSPHTDKAAVVVVSRLQVFRV